MALRAAVLRHVRVAVQTRGLESNPWFPSGSIRLMSSHDDHLTKEEVADRVLSVIKSFPKVDPSRVRTDFNFVLDLIFIIPVDKLSYKLFEDSFCF
ncbi:hypothetical protein OIU74_007209 [Salix koriyanagi]|uniref:Acyl carrier protein n=1 Tax=Salix koriyanagi TaxID=2511006 RepID=A0A9Q0U322_9ROSI|nr:hypothetical protein OIU74_007209 [Salix koriyanagi]